MSASQVDDEQSKLARVQEQRQQECDTNYLEFSKFKQAATNRRCTDQLSDNERIITIEIDKCLINWYEPWKKTFLDDGPEFSVIYDLMEGLLHYESQILSNETVLPCDRLNAIAKAVARLIDYGNAILNIDITIRANDETFREVNPLSMTTIELYKAHIKAHKLREKLLLNYFRTTNKRNSSDDDSPTGNLQHQFGTSSSLRVPANSSSHPSPTMDRSQRFSVGSNTSINTLVSGAIQDGRRTPQQLNSSYIEVKTLSSTEDLTEDQLEMRHMIATLRSSTFSDAQSSSIRLALLEVALTKVESLLRLPMSSEKLTNCFNLLDTIFDTIEKWPTESCREEVNMIARSLLKTLVRKVYIDDRDYHVEFQHSHWTTYLLSLIRLMTASDFNLYLKNFSNLPDLSSFLKDYLFIIKRLISHQTDEYNASNMLPTEPVYPACWIEMSLLVCSTFLRSLTYLYQFLRQYFASNVQMWLSYIDCLMHHLLQDALKCNRPLLKERQALLADDLRKTSADYIWISWDSLNKDQKYQISDDLLEPLLKVCIQLSSRQRSILLPIFHDMMQCDYTNQYISPRGTICGSDSICSQTTVAGIDSKAMYIYEAEFEQASNRRGQLDSSSSSLSSSNTSQNQIDGALSDSNNQPQLITSMHPQILRVNSHESLPYLSLQDQNFQQQHDSYVLPQIMQSQNQCTSSSDDGTVLTKFTHLMIGKLSNLVIELNLGDEQFKNELCLAISGELDSNYVQHSSNQSNLLLPTLNDLTQFKLMAKHTANLISEFIQISLDSRQANKLSYNHLHLLCLFKLILFFRDKVDRIELYLANLHKLWCLHHTTGRFVEAGFTLLEHAKSLPWSNKPLESHYRIITRSFQTPEPLSNFMSLKLFLYTTIIEYFDQGQLWEAAVPLCRELIDIYQFRLYDYEKLAQILAKLSIFFTNISSGQMRSHPEYFRVTFYGIGFPECLRNLTMVYRGKPFEKLSDFQSTLLSKYPDAKLLKTLEQPDESILAEPDAKYLQINACTPIADLKKKFNSTSLDVSQLHDYIIAYFKQNECDKFEFSRRMSFCPRPPPPPPPSPPPTAQLSCNNVSSDTLQSLVYPQHQHHQEGSVPQPQPQPQPRQKQQQQELTSTEQQTSNKGGDDFANMWRQRITLTTSSLPGMLPFFPVFLQETSIISPIECAIEDLERANDRLSSMVNRFKADKRQEEDVRPLGQLLLGIVDAAVNGGITKYEEAFFTNTTKDISMKNNNSSSSNSNNSNTKSVDKNKNNNIKKSTTYSSELIQVPLIQTSSSPSSALAFGSGVQKAMSNLSVSNATTKYNKHSAPTNGRSGGGHHDANNPMNSIPPRLPVQTNRVVDKCQQQENNGTENVILATNTSTTKCNDDYAFGDAYVSRAPTASQVKKLKSLIAGQVPLLDEAIKLHRDRVADIMRPQHDHLEASYKRLKHHIMSKYSRYLPSDYNRHHSAFSSHSFSSSSSAFTSNTLRSYRSLARSPNRSVRSDSRITAAGLPTSDGLGRFHSKRMSDVGGGGGRSTMVTTTPKNFEINHDGSVTITASPGGDNDDADIYPSNRAYKQLNNERRSLPFLSGVGGIIKLDNRADKSTNKLSKPDKAAASPAPPPQALATHQSSNSSEEEVVEPPPPTPPTRPRATTFRSPLRSLQDRIVPPVPQSSSVQARTMSGDSTYVCLSDLHKRPPQAQASVTTPSQTSEMASARLLPSEDDDQEDCEDDLDEPTRRNRSSTNVNDKLAQQ